jgi:hypothetical protein
MDSLSKEHQSERSLTRKIYETFECHLGTVGLRISKRCVEVENWGPNGGYHFEKEVMRNCEQCKYGKSEQTCPSEPNHATPTESNLIILRENLEVVLSEAAPSAMQLSFSS